MTSNSLGQLKLNWLVTRVKKQQSNLVIMLIKQLLIITQNILNYCKLTNLTQILQILILKQILQKLKKLNSIDFTQ